MAGVRLSTLVRRLRREVPAAGSCSDADLLARFARDRDDAAFELLVWRHGAMVLGACRRVLGHAEDAEDATQATFLVLARKAGGISRGGTLPAWLHRVALRIAGRLARSRRRTAPLEGDRPARPEPDPVDRADGLAVLDEEINRLPDRCRRAVVLCYLEGLTAAEAGRRLGCPTGTVESRLAAARKTLRDRLTRRGVTLPAGTFAVLGGQGVLAPEAVARVAQAAAAFVYDGAAAASEIAGESSVQLARGALAMWGTRTWGVVAAVVAVVAVTAGVGWADRDRPADPGKTPAGEQAVAAADPPVAAPPRAKAEGPADRPSSDQPWPLVERYGPFADGIVVGITPDGRSLILLSRNAVSSRVISGKKTKAFQIISPNWVSGAAVSPDGKYVATAEGSDGVKVREIATGQITEALWPSGKLPVSKVAFTPDGTHLVALGRSHAPDAAGGGRGSFGYPSGPRGPGAGSRPPIQERLQVAVWAVAGWKELSHPVETLPETIDRVVLAGNGRFVLREELRPRPAPGPTRSAGSDLRLAVTDAITGAARRTVEARNVDGYRTFADPLSPDGKTLAVTALGDDTRVRLLDVATGKERAVLSALRRPVGTVTFSPDGKLVAAASGDTPGRGGAPGVETEEGTTAGPSEVVIWDTATGREISRWADKDTVRQYGVLKFSPDGACLAAQSFGSQAGVTILGKLPTEPDKPAGPPTTGSLPAAAAPVGIPGRFQALVQSLSAETVDDARRVEGVFLAALGRLPTEVEARTLSAQLANQTDRAAAVRDLLNTLVGTAEFKAHAAALGQLANGQSRPAPSDKGGRGSGAGRGNPRQ